MSLMNSKLHKILWPRIYNSISAFSIFECGPFLKSIFQKLRYLQPKKTFNDIVTSKLFQRPQKHEIINEFVLTLKRMEGEGGINFIVRGDINNMWRIEK